jgi:hypothetical protein
MNRAWSVVNGDTSHKVWEEAPEWQRTSAIAGVNFILANPNAPESATHDSWLAVKREAGWTYGVEKNEILKTHPCFVPFEALPKVQQYKDKLFRSVVEAMM